MASVEVDSVPAVATLVAEKVEATPAIEEPTAAEPAVEDPGLVSGILGGVDGNGPRANSGLVNGVLGGVGNLVGGILGGAGSVPTAAEPAGGHRPSGYPYPGYTGYPVYPGIVSGNLEGVGNLVGGIFGGAGSVPATEEVEATPAAK